MFLTLIFYTYYSIMLLCISLVSVFLMPSIPSMFGTLPCLHLSLLLTFDSPMLSTLLYHWFLNGQYK